MKINITKSSIPIIWLDTFFLIEYNKVNFGLSNDYRYVELYNLIKEKVDTKRLICIRAEQEEEIYDYVADTMKSFLSFLKTIDFA